MSSRTGGGWSVVLIGTSLLLAACTGCDKSGSTDAPGTGMPAEGGQGNPSPDTPGPTPGDSTKTTAVYLDQGWSKDTREQFYHLTQGSQFVPYSWFLALEQADNQELFRADENMERLGFISQPKTTHNPDSLPIGFARDDNPGTVTESYAIRKASLGPNYQVEDYPATNSWLGLTCAACHTNDIHYKGVVIRIDGGPTLADPETFEVEIAAALRATVDDDEKFDRFARRVREGLDEAGTSEVEAAALRRRLDAYTGVLEKSIQDNRVPDLPYGFARLDAFGAILNKVCGATLEIPENQRSSSAPVSFPFLWNTPELDWVQWNGSASNAIARNVGEVMGVFAHLKLTGTPQEGQFTSTVDIQRLFQLEEWIAELSAPKWPEEILGEIDEEKAQLGRTLFAENCSGCHGVRDANGAFPMTAPNRFQKQFIKTHMITVFPPDEDQIGTDPMMVKNVVTRTAKTGALSAALGGTPEAPAVRVLGAAVSGVIKRELSEIPNQSPEELQELAIKLSGYHDPDIGPPNVFGYKARPLNGIWATAPYLHNGSVPNLYQLLLPAGERVRSFWVGSRDFDPVHVGFETHEYAGGFELRTVDGDGNPIPGNLNSGHEGPGHTQTKGDDGQYRDFTDDERWAIIEYMKTLE